MFGKKNTTYDPSKDLKNQPVPEGSHLLEVDDLKMYFHTQDGVVKAVDGVSYTLDRGETLGVVGESGSGKSVTSLTIMGLIEMPPGRIEGGDVRYRGKSLLQMSDEEMQHIRGNDIAMIFQDPMTSLNPVYTIGRQLGEGLRLHRGYTIAADHVICYGDKVRDILYKELESRNTNMNTTIRAMTPADKDSVWQLQGRS